MDIYHINSTIENRALRVSHMFHKKVTIIPGITGLNSSNHIFYFSLANFFFNSEEICLQLRKKQVEEETNKAQSTHFTPGNKSFINVILKPKIIILFQ